MSFLAKRELLARVAPRYRSAPPSQKSVILDEFVAVTGYDRKYAIRLLAHPIPVPLPLARPRERFYGAAVQDALVVAWAAANRICAKRLVPFLPELVPALERHGHLALTDPVRAQLLALSPATADRILRPYRERDAPHGMTTTRRGLLIKQQVPVRTFTGWDDVVPGFFEADLVAHCGPWAEGAFLQTLVLTDVATGWTECIALLHRSRHTVIQALDRARTLLPIPLLGLDTDNGMEFINTDLLDYCTRERITFTRGRVAKKNDQCFVEQKNGAIVRQLVGYDRFEGEQAYRQLTELYRAVRLYVNFFQPSMKLRLKEREGGKLRRRYDPAKTPFQRLLAMGVLSTDDRVRLTAIAQALDPVQLLRQIQQLQDALWRHALIQMPESVAANIKAMQEALPTIRFSLDGASAPETRIGTESEGGRKYRRTKGVKGPRLYRTRVDPFAEVWHEVEAELTAHPERTAKAAFEHLQERYPGVFPATQVRTLQRRVQEWRVRTLLAFDDQWLGEEVLVRRSLPLPLRAIIVERAEGERGKINDEATVAAG
ncbi:MAG: transposase [Chloroflexota bacterium]|nr:transposase [Chloroflexota bacterium]